MSSASLSKDRPPRHIYGMVAEFASPHALLEGVRAVRKAGFTRIDTHTPFPIHGMDKAMGLPPSKLPWLVFAGGLTGAVSAFLLQWWTNAVDYQFLVGGKPVFSYQAYVPVCFELTVLLSAFCAVLGLLALCGLPRPYHPLFLHPRFARATDDGFFLSVEAADPLWDEAVLRRVLTAAGGSEIAIIREAPEGGVHV
ncbi:MAG: DUF3341 domain-containing protein [Myxococcales bacterium]|nr:DUF3341 domain-containing protein [Myxococcota bacterium]MDW8282720.1 DUF3341 domain-containing protein [Myxococcales bacterium]